MLLYFLVTGVAVVVAVEVVKSKYIVHSGWLVSYVVD